MINGFIPLVVEFVVSPGNTFFLHRVSIKSVTDLSAAHCLSPSFLQDKFSINKENQLKKQDLKLFLVSVVNCHQRAAFPLTRRVCF